MSSLRLKPGDKKPPFSLSSPSGSSSSSSPSPANEPTPPTAAHSPEMMKVFGSKGLKNDVGIVVCPQCTKPVLKSAMGDHTGVFARFYTQSGRDCLWALVYRDVQDDPNEWPGEERRSCYASSHCSGYRFEWKHGTSSWYVHFGCASTTLRVTFRNPFDDRFALCVFQSSRYMTDVCKLLRQNLRKHLRRNARQARWRLLARSIILVLLRKYVQSRLQE